MKFTISHHVVIDRPLDEVFPVLARVDDLERVLRLSPMLARFALLEQRPGPAPDTEVLVFEFDELVPVLPRLYTAKVTMQCEQTIDAAARRVDYRSHSVRGVGITIHKVRTFAGAGPGATEVTETIEGQATPGLHLVARHSARKQHRLHMSKYAELFAAPGS